MKKSIVFLFIAGIFFCSCTKEVDNESTEQYNKQVDKQRVLTITSTLSDVKTTYDGETTFKWIEGDVIGVYMTLGETSGLYEFTAAATGASVKFTHVLTDEEQVALGSGEPVYGTHAYYPYNSGDASITVGGTDANPTVTLAGTITQPTTNPMSIIPMVGKNNGSGTYSFIAITGILKLTISDVPEEAQKVHLIANGQAFNGVYNLQEATNELYVDLNHFTSGYTDKQILFTPTTDGDDYDDPVSTGDTRVFYFPIPEGTIQSGMTVHLKNGSGSVLMSRVTNEPITINRNKITPLATFTTWKSLGTGKFIDSRTFTEAGKTPEYVDVQIQQSRIYPNRFRLVNPYGTAWSHYSYSWPESWAPNGPSEYLSFYTMSQGESYPYGTPKPQAASNGKVYFYPHFTGSNSLEAHAVSGGSVKTEIRLTHSNFHNNDHLAESQVYKYQSSGLPANVSLHPRYGYRKNNSGNTFSEDTNILIAFPGCSELAYGDYSASITAGGTSNSITATLDLGANVAEAKVVLAESESAGTALIDADNAAVQTLNANGTTSALSVTNITASGLCYIVVCTYDSGANKMMTYNVPVYYLTDADKNEFCKQHTDGRAAVENSGPRTLTDMTITFAVSDDVTKGNILLTEFHGMSYNAAPSSGARFYTLTETDEGGTFSAGAPMYGVYTPSSGYNAINLTFQSQSAFFTYNDHEYRICAASASATTWNFCLHRNSTEHYYIRNWNEPTYLRDITAVHGYTYSYYFEAYHYDSWIDW